MLIYYPILCWNQPKNHLWYINLILDITMLKPWWYSFEVYYVCFEKLCIYILSVSSSCWESWAKGFPQEELRDNERDPYIHMSQSDHILWAYLSLTKKCKIIPIRETLVPFNLQCTDIKMFGTRLVKSLMSIKGFIDKAVMSSTHVKGQHVMQPGRF